MGCTFDFLDCQTQNGEDPCDFFFGFSCYPTQISLGLGCGGSGSGLIRWLWLWRFFFFFCCCLWLRRIWLVAGGGDGGWMWRLFFLFSALVCDCGGSGWWLVAAMVGGCGGCDMGG